MAELNVKNLLMAEEKAPVVTHTSEYFRDANAQRDSEIHWRRSALQEAKRMIMDAVEMNCKTAPGCCIARYEELMRHIDEVLKAEANDYGC